jgi:hypothetical protein
MSRQSALTIKELTAPAKLLTDSHFMCHNLTKFTDLNYLTNTQLSLVIYKTIN